MFNEPTKSLFGTVLFLIYYVVVPIVFLLHTVENYSYHSTEEHVKEAIQLLKEQVSKVRYCTKN